MQKEDIIKGRYYELLSEDDKFNLLVVKDIEIDELKEKLAKFETLQESTEQNKLDSSEKSDNVLMNMLYDNYDLNEQFHKEVRNMIFTFVCAHYREKLTLKDWLEKYYNQR